MSTRQSPESVAAGRLSADTYADNFAERQAPLDATMAEDAAARCLFCDDAPCTLACPTGIDVPHVIGEIQAGMLDAAARSLFDRNILAGSCARVCPVERLCEGACVVVTAGNPPVEIARLHRFAADTAIAKGGHPFARADATGKRIAVVGAGPAGLACAHRLAMKGHEVVLHDARERAGGMNEYGIAAYKLAGGVAQQEIEWLLRIGGISLRTGLRMGRDLTLAALREDFDAVFLAIGLGGVQALRAEGADKSHVYDAVDFIADLRQTPDKSRIPVGNRIVVIGGGRTALDAAVQARLLGAEHVTLVFGRDSSLLNDSLIAEQHHAASKGVHIKTGAVPLRILGDDGVEAVEFAYVEESDGTVKLTDRTFRVKADQVFKALGQQLDGIPDGLELLGRRIAITDVGRTNLDGVWAGGDCASGGDDLTATAVAQGRDAADDMHAALIT